MAAQHINCTADGSPMTGGHIVEHKREVAVPHRQQQQVLSAAAYDNALAPFWTRVVS
jgi:hypothetical protein